MHCTLSEYEGQAQQQGGTIMKEQSMQGLIEVALHLGRYFPRDPETFRISAICELHLVAELG